MKVYSQLKYLKDKYLEFHQSFQEDDLEEIQTSLEESTKEKGHIYEEDFFTELIRKLISEVKEKNKKKVVLVIDDLDRLDPDHIFRLLNIFSAHIDFGGVENDNKFDFDKVILVCDYNNIESVFTHRYGLNSNFSGYINKFYDDIYWYNSSSLIKEIISSYLSKIETDAGHNVFDRNGVYDHIKFILNELLDKKLISFRNLVKFKRSVKLSSSYRTKMKNLSKQSTILQLYTLHADLIILFFVTFFNNNKEFLKIIEKAENDEIVNVSPLTRDVFLDYISNLLLFINHNTYTIQEYEAFENKDFNLSFKMNTFVCNTIIDRMGKSIGMSCKEIRNHKNHEIGIDQLNYFSFLKPAVNVYFGLIKK